MFRLSGMSMWMTVAAVLGMALCPAAFAAGSGTGIVGGASGAGKTVLLEDFEAYAEADNWDGGGVWKIKVQDGVSGAIAIGKAYGKPGEGGKESKGLLFRNTKVELPGRLKWVNVSRDLKEVIGAPVFTLHVSYLCPSGKAPHSGRVDLSMSEQGDGQILFISFAPSTVFIYKDDTKNKKTLYARATSKAGEWHKVSIEVDHEKDKFRVSIDGEIVKGDWGEWANFRYDKTIEPQKLKSIRFNAGHTWPSSVRHIDDITITVPERRQAPGK